MQLREKGKTEFVASRFGSFSLGFATGALTVVAYRRLREYVEAEDYERLADTVQANLQELEARIAQGGPISPKKSSRKVTKQPR